MVKKGSHGVIHAMSTSRKQYIIASHNDTAMTRDISYYTEQLDNAIYLLAEDPDFLSKLSLEIAQNGEIEPNDKQALLIRIVQLNEKYTTQQQYDSNEEEEAKRPQNDFPSYHLYFEGDDTPCGLKEYGCDENTDYANWLLHTYLPTFHPMPNQELQHPLVTVFMLLNCQAGRDNQKIPLVYYSGLRGSGKSEIGKAMTMHYPKHLRVDVRPNSTGAGFRDALDAAFKNNQPGIMYWDNWRWQMCLQKIADHYAILLANCRADSISILSTRGDNNQSVFRTHCLKVFSSIEPPEPIDDSSAELCRRMWGFICKTALPKDDRNFYSWDNMQNEYKKYWGHENKDNVANVYNKILKRISSLSRDKIHCDSYVWEMLQIPCAVYEFIGLGNAEEALKLFIQHREWCAKESSGTQDTYLVLISNFLKDLKLKHEEALDNPLISANAYNLNLIKVKDIKDFLSSQLEIKISESNLNKIKDIMAGKGYLYKLIKNEQFFIKQ